MYFNILGVESLLVFTYVCFELVALSLEVLNVLFKSFNVSGCLYFVSLRDRILELGNFPLKVLVRRRQSPNHIIQLTISFDLAPDIGVKPLEFLGHDDNLILILGNLVMTLG